ncbi:hypothetical protein A2716_03980 [candidate division WWE3 bacterium RIFCSPHIGHO2_01_FULL_40_23]|uniref:Uncharacterized protein n=1 Tax=candidate division WWE3 bacterium RIFCSPLOWO2_01_FULL_41_18 TaxID=1802625 RepID=A0A1F4VCV9_UNCKA|nr:MAG: hypothetical protein A2716_03980 [candidate division WWE3 bacterium RIFCSPHIGHO2_01_FULL_40_23]OGC55035.1 MAG: hypothetical protein A3A78_03590 [candidate division WWE3 bacterium RIFCSPLOWO2_01_FULL_41_18]
MEKIELSEYIEKVLSDVEKGSGNRYISSDVDFEVKIEKIEKLEAGLKAYIANAGGEQTKGETHTVKFSVRPNQHESHSAGIVRRNDDSDKDWRIGQ